MRRLSLLLIVASAAVLLVSVVVSGQEGTQMFDGQYLYERSCSSCHGATGEGVGLFGPNLRESAFILTSNEDAIASVIQMGRKYRDKQFPEYSGMPKFQFIRAGEAAALIAYLKGPLQKMTGEIRDRH